MVQGLREHAGLSRKELGELVRYSKHTVASVELGRRMPDPAFVERAEEALGNTGALRRTSAHLARQPGLAAWFRQWARLEQVAITLYTYECRMVPGLLQTEAYVRAMAAELRNVEIQVMPLVRTSHSGLQGPIRLLETSANKWFAYDEGQESGQLLTDVKVVGVLQRRYARMRSQALTLQDSMTLLQRMRGDL
ncbi:Scr1 family TA system antitoxin-like transcriptional regulator [Streptomyces sp. NPDC006134]|uniref:helix-turn-helix domain-containing protein n=1 Tax=Streptomyces sp. NPDC006134 TaxID=3154467 RepID=UPI0033F140FC